MSHDGPINGGTRSGWPADRRLAYIVDLVASRQAYGFVAELATEQRNSDGTWDLPRALAPTHDDWRAVPDTRDREIAQMLTGAGSQNVYTTAAYPRSGPFVLDGDAIATTLRAICDTGRCRIRLAAREQPAGSVAFDPGPAWTLHVRVAPAANGEVVVDGMLRREGEEMPLAEPVVIHNAGILLARGAFSRFDAQGAFPFVLALRDPTRLSVRHSDTHDDLPTFLEALYAMPRRPHIELPDALDVTEVRQAPRPGLIIHPAHSRRPSNHRLEQFFITRTPQDRRDRP